MIIGIGGVSRAGKTTLAEWLRNQFPGKKTHLICQDEFAYPTEQLPRIKDRIDWEHPDSIDHERFKKSILAESKLNDIVIAEGLLVFHDRLTNNLYDSMLLVEIDYQTFLDRKEHDHRWGHEPDWYVKHIWESYLKYGQSPEPQRTLIVDGTKKFPPKTILNFIG